MRKASTNGPARAAHAYQLVQAVAQHEKRKVEVTFHSCLDLMQSADKNYFPILLLTALNNLM